MPDAEARLNALNARIAAFCAWLDEREADYDRRVKRTHFNQRLRDIYKTEAAELEVVAKTFREMVTKPGRDAP